MTGHFSYRFSFLVCSFIVLFLSSGAQLSLKGKNRTKFGIFKVQTDLKTVVMNGTISGSTLRNFQKLLELYPNIKLIEMHIIPGSKNDEINLQVAQLIHDQEINTHIIDNGVIASGGVDFFLAGIKRTMGTNSHIGVHSWSGRNEKGQRINASDLPKNHKDHNMFIDFYQSIGFTPDKAKSFYFFTIHAAPVEGIHWMTADEIEEYGVLNSKLN